MSAKPTGISTEADHLQRAELLNELGLEPHWVLITKEEMEILRKDFDGQAKTIQNYHDGAAAHAQVCVDLRAEIARISKDRDEARLAATRTAVAVAHKENRIEALEQPRTPSTDPWKIIEDMRRQMAVLRDQIPKWRSCSAELPDTEDIMLVFVPDADDDMVKGYFNGRRWHGMDGKRIWDEVTHWQPLPDEPEAE